MRGQGDSTAHRTLDLHVTNQGLIPTHIWFSEPIGIIPEGSTRYNWMWPQRNN